MQAGHACAQFQCEPVDLEFEAALRRAAEEEPPSPEPVKAFPTFSLNSWIKQLKVNDTVTGSDVSACTGAVPSTDAAVQEPCVAGTGPASAAAPQLFSPTKFVAWNSPLNLPTPPAPLGGMQSPPATPPMPCEFSTLTAGASFAADERAPLGPIHAHASGPYLSLLHI